VPEAASLILYAITTCRGVIVIKICKDGVNGKNGICKRRLLQN
jgi:hypothetical protein